MKISGFWKISENITKTTFGLIQVPRNLAPKTTEKLLCAERVQISVGVRNYKQITPLYFFSASRFVWRCQVVSSRRSPPPILWILASALDVPGLDHDDTQKPGVSFQ